MSPGKSKKVKSKRAKTTTKLCSKCQKVFSSRGFHNHANVCAPDETRDQNKRALEEALSAIAEVESASRLETLEAALRREQVAGPSSHHQVEPTRNEIAGQTLPVVAEQLRIALADIDDYYPEMDSPQLSPMSGVSNRDLNFTNVDNAVPQSLPLQPIVYKKDDVVVEFHPSAKVPPKHYPAEPPVSGTSTGTGATPSLSSRQPTHSANIRNPGEVPKESQIDEQFQPPWHPFASEIDFDIAELTLETHMNSGQINRLLSILKRTAQSPDDFTLTNNKDLMDMWTLARRRTHGLTKTTSTVPYHDEEIEFDVWSRPLWDWCLELLDDKETVSQFHWDAEHQYKHDGEKLVQFWDEPWTGEAWWKIQDAIPEGGKPLCILIYADKTRLSTFGTAQGHPVIARCANLPVNMRNGMGFSGARLVGWLPVIAEKSGESGRREYINLKRLIWHKAFYEILKSLEPYAQTGCIHMCADGIRRWLFPIILILSADYEEQCFMAGIRGGRSKFPCPVCLVPDIALSDVSQIFTLRTSAEMKAIYLQAQQPGMTKAAKEKLLKGYGLRDIENVFWCLENTDVYQAISWDRLHAYHGGLFSDHLWEEFKRLVNALPGQSAAQMVDDQVNQTPRWTNLNHFSSLMKTAQFADGTKYEDMSKVIIYASHNVLTPVNSPEGFLLLQIMRSYLELDMYASLGAHTEITIAAGREELEVYNKLIQTHKTTYNTKVWDFPKAHSHQHLFDDICLKGVTRNYNTKPNEKQHRPLKKFYLHHTNFKNTDEQILRLDHNALAALIIRKEVDVYNVRKQQLEELKIDGASKPKKERVIIGTSDLSFGSTLPKQTLGVIEQMHGLDDLAFREFRKKLSRSLTRYTGSIVRLDQSYEITPYQSLKVNYESTTTWQTETDILRANPHFHGAPRYDFVLAQAPNGNNDTVLIAQLLYIFSVTFHNKEWFMALILPMDRPISARNKARDKTLRFTRVHTRERAGAAIIDAETIIRGTLLTQDHGSQGEDEFLMLKEIDDDLWWRMKSCKIAISTNI